MHDFPGDPVPSNGHCRILINAVSPDLSPIFLRSTGGARVGGDLPRARSGQQVACEMGERTGSLKAGCADDDRIEWKD